MSEMQSHNWPVSMPPKHVPADTVQAEGIYAATAWTRQCLSEALAEKAGRSELREEQAIAIGRQILRENALKLFPTLRRQLWRKAE